MIWSISNHLNDSELNFNVQNSVHSISKFAGFLLNFRWYLDNHFNMQGLLLFFPGQVRRNCFMCWNKIKTIIATLSAGHQHNSTDHHSDQLKNSKFYENSSEYANFSKSSAQWATTYLEYEIPILVKSDDLWSHKTTFKH